MLGFSYGLEAKQRKKTLFCHQVGQIWSYRALVKALESSRRDLAIEKGFRACFLRDDYAALFVQSAVTPHTGRTADGYALTSGGDNLVREGVGEAWRVRDEAGPMARWG